MTKANEQKKEFAWDSEEVIGNLIVSDKEKHSIKVCTLNGKQFVVATKIVNKAKGGWTPVKNSTMEMSVFEAVTDAVSGWKLTEAFSGESGKAVATLAKESTKPMKGKKEEPQAEAPKPKRTRTSTSTKKAAK